MLYQVPSQACSTVPVYCLRNDGSCCASCCGYRGKKRSLENTEVRSRVCTAKAEVHSLGWGRGGGRVTRQPLLYITQACKAPSTQFHNITQQLPSVLHSRDLCMILTLAGQPIQPDSGVKERHLSVEVEPLAVFLPGPSHQPATL